MTDPTGNPPGDPDDLPAEALQRLNALMERIVEISQGNDLAAMDEALADLQRITEETGVEIPGLADRIRVLRGGTSATHDYLANIDAALWVGDLPRVRALNAAGPPATEAMSDIGLALDGIEWEEEDWDDEASANEDDEEEEMFELDLDDLFADLPPIPETPAEILPDLYADIAEGVPGALSAFLISGEDPNLPRGEAQHTALLAALDAPGRRADQIEALIAAGADPKVIHFQGDNALSWAAGYHHPETVSAETEIALMTLLASHGVDPDHWTEVQNWNVLHRAIIQGDGNRVAGILAAGADAAPRIPDRFLPEKLAGLTPLMVAVPKPDVVQRLLDHGCDPAEPDAQGRTPLAFTREEAAQARRRATPDDPWTQAHAESIERSLALLQAAAPGA